MCADNLMCVSRDPDVLLRAARFTAVYVRLVGEEPAPSKCVLMSASGVTRMDMRGWVLIDGGLRRSSGHHFSWLVRYSGCTRPSCYCPFGHFCVTFSFFLRSVEGDSVYVFFGCPAQY